MDPRAVGNPRQQVGTIDAEHLHANGNRNNAECRSIVCEHNPVAICSRLALVDASPHSYTVVRGKRVKSRHPVRRGGCVHKPHHSAAHVSVRFARQHTSHLGANHAGCQPRGLRVHSKDAGERPSRSVHSNLEGATIGNPDAARLRHYRWLHHVRSLCELDPGTPRRIEKRCCTTHNRVQKRGRGQRECGSPCTIVHVDEVNLGASHLPALFRGGTNNGGR
jgi:hypothetical protein